MTKTLAYLAFGLALMACKKPIEPLPGDRTTCDCTYLTDFDDTAHVVIEVCAARGKPLTEEASACAMHSAHNHIDECKCQPLAAPCDAHAADACVDR